MTQWLASVCLQCVLALTSASPDPVLYLQLPRFLVATVLNLALTLISGSGSDSRSAECCWR